MNKIKKNLSYPRPAASSQRSGNLSVRLRVGFTLVELMIIVAILGILSAIVIPEFSGHIQKTKESSAKDNLRLYREAVERFAADNNDIPPGYQLDDLSQPPKALRLNIQLTQNNDYLSKMPVNPFKGLSNTYIVLDGESLPTSEIEGYGWIYQPSTKTIILNKDGVDSEGVAYFDY